MCENYKVYVIGTLSQVEDVLEYLNTTELERYGDKLVSDPSVGFNEYNTVKSIDNPANDNVGQYFIKAWKCDLPLHLEFTEQRVETNMVRMLNEIENNQG